MTITAQAKRALSLWSNKGEADPRPVPGAAYQMLLPVFPLSPFVPAGAVGELKVVRRSP